MLRSSRALWSQDWSKTLRLPKSKLQPRPAHTGKDRAALFKQCTDDLYAWQAAQRPASNRFVLHDGPPYANGSLHIGHAVNKIVKDIICRFQLLQGKQVHYVPGWDCHGLPIEVKALQDHPGDVKTLTPAQVRKSAAKLAHKTVKEQMKSFREWAVMGDWDAAYKTMDRSFEVRQLQVFADMVSKGLIYRQHKPVHWSPSSRTALAEAELEYDDNHESLAAYVGFRLTHIPQTLKAIEDALGDSIYLLVWTTTPWTLPANSAIGLHAELEYCLVQMDGFYFIVATDLVPSVAKNAGLAEPQILAKFPGLLLVDRCQYVPSLCNDTQTAQPVIHADFVSGNSGTGLVHLAAGHGFDDYKVCTQLGIDMYSPIDDDGCFATRGYPGLPVELDGISVLNGGSQAVLDYMKTRQNPGAIDYYVLGSHKYRHKYPIDWRTKQPIITRATSQWFADAGTIQKPAIDALRPVKFIPDPGRSRLESFTSSRTQWCISRQRSWGVPIPALYRHREDGSVDAVMSAESIQHIIKTIESRGTDAWFNDAEDDPAWIAPSLPAAKYTRGKDTMDVWFDSGTTWTGLPDASGSHPPADVYFEGSDQHRGWFQSSLLTHVATQVSTNPSTGLLKQSAFSPHAPFKTLITHGFTMDQDGRKMSKSIGNTISPDQIMDGSLLPPIKKRKNDAPTSLPIHANLPPNQTYDAMGADALRLLVASSDYTKDVTIGEPILKAVNSSLSKLRTTLKWLTGNLFDYTPHSLSDTKTLIHQIHTSNANFQESRALANLAATTSAAHASFAAYEHFHAVQLLSRLVNHDLSAVFFESAKDALYAGSGTQRAIAQLVCFEILASLLTMLAPILPLLVQETLVACPRELRDALTTAQRHPFQRVWRPDEDARLLLAGQQAHFADKVRVVDQLGAQMRMLQEQVRGAKLIGQGLECRVLLDTRAASPGVQAFLADMAQSGGLAKAWVVSAVQVESGGATDEAEWRYEGAVDLEPGALGDGASTVRVAVVRAVHDKCERCWQYTAPTGEGLCGRCADVVRSLGEA